MPGGDRTGPTGSGSMTGKRAGYCAGFNAPGSFNPGLGGGNRPQNLGGFGMGRGRRNRYYATGLTCRALSNADIAVESDIQSETPLSENKDVSSKANAILETLVSLEKRILDLETQVTNK